MQTEFCPNCRALRQMNQLSSTRTKLYRDGTMVDVPIVVFSCMTCNQFVMSEDAVQPSVVTLDSESPDRREGGPDTSPAS